MAKDKFTKHIFISTDLEPDDMLALRVMLKNFDENTKYHILVGEGDKSGLKARADFVSHYLDMAIQDGIITEEQVKSNFEILIGSPTPQGAYVDHAKSYYNENFISKFVKSDTSYLEDVGALNHIQSTIKEAKQDGQKVDIHMWKPLEDMPSIVNTILGSEEVKLTSEDNIYVSGSFNIREIFKKPNSTKIEAIDKMLNNSVTNNVLFEAFPTYEKPLSEDEKAHPKHIIHSKVGDELTSDQKANDAVAEFMLSDISNLGKLANEGRSVWNRGVSEDCIEGCIERVIKAAKKANNVVDATTVAVLEKYQQNLGKTVADTTKGIGEINMDFIVFFNRTLSKSALFDQEQLKKDYPDRVQGEGENAYFQFLKGTETIQDQVLPEFANILGDDLFGFFNFNYKILEVIIRDQNEMIIGDATCAVYAQHPELFQVLKSEVNYGASERGRLFYGNKDGSLAYENKDKEVVKLPGGNCKVIRGVTNYESVMEALMAPVKSLETEDADMPMVGAETTIPEDLIGG